MMYDDTKWNAKCGETSPHGTFSSVQPNVKGHGGFRNYASGFLFVAVSNAWRLAYEMKTLLIEFTDLRYSGLAISLDDVFDVAYVVVVPSAQMKSIADCCWMKTKPICQHQHWIRQWPNKPLR